MFPTHERGWAARPGHSGSTYKPVYYSLALDRGYGYASLLNDTPRAEVDPITGEVWVPQTLPDLSP